VNTTLNKSASKLTRDAADDKAVGGEKIRGKISASLGFMVPVAARGGAGVEAETERREFVSGVDDDGGCQETVAEEGNNIASAAACERMRESEREREHAPGERMKPKSRDVKAGGKSAIVRESLAGVMMAMRPKSAGGGAHGEEGGGQGGAGFGAESQKAAKPFLKRKTKTIPVSNGPTNWDRVTSKVDAKFKVPCVRSQGSGFGVRVLLCALASLRSLPPSVHPSIHPSIRPSVRPHARNCIYTCMYTLLA